MHHFQRHQHERDLVSVSRELIDDNIIQGFVLASSETLVVLQYVYDFQFDGLMVLRTADITGVESTKTDRFQRELLEQEGLLARVPFGMAFDLRDWRSVITQLAAEHDFMILECETSEEPDFLIGRALETDDEAVYFAYFSGIGVWAAAPDEVQFDDLTSCQVDTSYLNFYRRHFARQDSGAR
jgi:hypothetical protein